ncbi:MAG TPA: hypothetical protein VE505_12975 [Vicinamibacterales bacterium]|nr:hypothetical protein [Vicinamibacterales bacterium]
MYRLASLVAVAAWFAFADAAALAAPPQPFSVETAGSFTSATSVAGTFTTAGAVTDAGSYTEDFSLSGNTIHAVKTLQGTHGTLVIAVTAVVGSPTSTTVSFRAGHWRIVSGTGAFTGLRGGGSPGASGLADLAVGTVQFAHEGTVVLPAG